MLNYVLCIILLLFQVCNGADLSIQIPVSEYQDPNGLYRLDYNPPVGFPEPNSTFVAADITNAISFSQGLPGTKYHFRLHYTNNTINDWLTWTASITTSKNLYTSAFLCNRQILASLTLAIHQFDICIHFTAPDPPANLSINVRPNKHVHLAWDPPSVGGYSKFKLRLIPLSDRDAQPRNFIEEKPPVILRDLVAGASYEIQLFTMFENKESTAYISGNFTTSKLVIFVWTF